MHPNNLHNASYDFNTLQSTTPALKEYVFINEHNIQTIDFSDAQAIKALNKALLNHYYDIKHWDIPEEHLCPPIPNRADYIHYIADMMQSKKSCKGLDVGVGANCIYPLLASQIYNWTMVGADISETSIKVAQKNANEARVPIDIRLQGTPANIFKGIILEGEYFDFTMCNPPFYTSEQEAIKANTTKNKNLHKVSKTGRNFGGVSNELWCNGGEALFIKRMIKQSLAFKDQVGVFTTLVSRKENVHKLLKLLKKLKAEHTIIDMQQGHKKSRILTWSFNS